jgi:hypothetical protein
MVPAVALAYAWPLVKQLFDCRSYRAPIRRGMHCNHDFERWRGTTTGGNETTSAFRALTGARTLKWKATPVIDGEKVDARLADRRFRRI